MWGKAMMMMKWSDLWRKKATNYHTLPLIQIGEREIWGLRKWPRSAGKLTASKTIIMASWLPKNGTTKWCNTTTWPWAEVVKIVNSQMKKISQKQKEAKLIEREARIIYHRSRSSLCRPGRVEIGNLSCLSHHWRPKRQHSMGPTFLKADWTTSCLHPT